jgi:hypothetical protein
MLAYVFWHWPRADVDRPAYEHLQQRFHDALLGAPPPGFLESRSAAITGAPWAGGGGSVYEDWYLLEGSAALDDLNSAAITASRRAPHDAAAAAAADGTAALYLLRHGDPRRTPRVATWFAKPTGMSYTELFERLAPLVVAGATVWCRQMVLGTAPEFCLHSELPAALPAPLLAHTVTSMRPVWP